MSKTNQFQLYYNNLSQYILKKGKKSKIKSKLKNNLKIYMKSNKKIPLLQKTCKNIEYLTPYIGLVSKRKGRNKNILVPKLLNEKQSLFLLYNWIITSSKEKSKKHFFYNIIQNLDKNLKDTEFVIKKKKNLYNQLLENVYNLKRRYFYRPKRKNIKIKNKVKKI